MFPRAARSQQEAAAIGEIQAYENIYPVGTLVTIGDNGSSGTVLHYGIGASHDSIDVAKAIVLCDSKRILVAAALLRPYVAPRQPTALNASDDDLFNQATMALARYRTWRDSPQRDEWKRRLSPDVAPSQWDEIDRIADGPERRGRELCDLDAIDALPGGRDALEFYCAEATRDAAGDLSGPDRFLVIVLAIARDHGRSAEFVMKTAPIAVLEHTSPTLARLAVARYLLRPSARG
jgi:hypothetical protein